MQKIIINPKASLFVVFAFLLFLLTCSQSNPEQDKFAQTKVQGVRDLEALKKAVQRLEEDPQLKHGFFAFSLLSNQTGKVILEQNAHKTLTVASVMKAVTTATALATLGEDFRFKTELAYSGTIEKGILKGDIYIKGGGDPTLGSQLLKNKDLNVLLTQWIQKIKALGIKEIQGAIIADEGIYTLDPTPSHWIWSDMGNYFGAPASAINVLDNTYKLYFQPGRTIGEQTSIIRTEPQLPALQLINEVKTAAAGSGDRASIAGAPYSPVRYVSGTIPLGGVFSIKGSIPNPALLLAEMLHQKATNSQIRVAQEPTTSLGKYLKNEKTDSKRTHIDTHSSPTLKEIVSYTNIHSVNLYAEALLKAIGLKLEKEGSTEAGTRAVTKFWEQQGVDVRGFFMHDGSGLSLANRITAAQLTAILHKISKNQYSAAFYNSLPIAGVSGTMYGVGNDNQARNNLRAKSGGMTRVQAYSGYFKTASGEQMCFAMITNQYLGEYAQVRKKLSDLMGVMVESL